MATKTNIETVLRKLMARRGITSGNALAELAKTDQPMIWRLLNGKVSNPRKSTVQPLLSYFNVSYAQLLGEESVENQSSPGIDSDQAGYANVVSGPDITMLVPEISWVQAGEWCEIIDNFEPGDFERVIPVSKKMSPRSFALKVQGDSMEPKFPEGCTIVVDPEREARNGSYVIARTASATEATFKQIVYDGSRVFLKPLNSRYPIIELTEGCSVCGVVRHMLTDFD